jgi:hypothetical protein
MAPGGADFHGTRHRHPIDRVPCWAHPSSMVGGAGSRRHQPPRRRRATVRWFGTLSRFCHRGMSEDMSRRLMLTIKWGPDRSTFLESRRIYVLLRDDTEIGRIEVCVPGRHAIQGHVTSQGANSSAASILEPSQAYVCQWRGARSQSRDHDRLGLDQARSSTVLRRARAGRRRAHGSRIIAPIPVASLPSATVTSQDQA